MANTSDQLVEGVKTRVTIPANQALLTDENILVLGDRVVQSNLVPLLISVMQNYFVVVTDVPIVAGQAEYDIPYRAMARSLRDLKMRDPGGSVRDLCLLASEDSHLFPVGVTPNSFFFRGDKISLVPAPAQSNLILEIWWELPPSQMTAVGNCAKVQSISMDDVVVTSVPTGITTGSEIDFVQGRSGNSLIDMDIPITNISGTTISFGSGVVPTTLRAGDYICPAMFAPVIMLPNECYPYLETETSRRVLTAIGDNEGAQALSEDASTELKNLKMILEPRIRGESTKVINRRGLLRGVRSRYRRGLIY